MYLTLKQQVKHLSKKEFRNLKYLCHIAKNLKNQAIYNVRQHYFNNKKYLSYNENYKILKNSENYKKLNSNMAQQILKEVDESFKSFFALLKLAKNGQYNGKIKLPNYLDKDGFTTLVIGFVRLKDDMLIVPYSNSFIGSINNQNFVNIPYGKLRDKLIYLCKLYGIEFKLQEESYTSKASFFDGDEIPIYDKENLQEYIFSGKRIKRGLYQTSAGKLINADCNGALNILRKSKVVDLSVLYNRGELNTPKRIRVV